MAVKASPAKDVEVGIARAVRAARSKHFINSPSHAHAIVGDLHGHIVRLYRDAPDDPLLYAYELRDALRRIAGMVIDLQKWADAVIDCTPDQIEEEGARLT